MSVYRVVLKDDSGSFASTALAESAGGSARNQVAGFDGQYDLAFIEVPEENAGYLEGLMEADENVVSYR